MSGASANIYQVTFTPTQVVRTWNVASLFAAATTEDNGLSLKGNTWTVENEPKAEFDTKDYVKGSGKPKTEDNKNAEGTIPCNRMLVRVYCNRNR